MARKTWSAVAVLLGLTIAVTFAFYMTTYSRTLSASGKAASPAKSTPSANCAKGNLNKAGSIADDPCPGSLTCMTYFCGGTSNNPYVCCPSGAPYLNHCDCQCYNSSSFDCGSYSYCHR